MEWTSLIFSILALFISIVVAIFHFRRDRRESKKFISENKQLKKKARFSISEIDYFLDSGPDLTGNFYEAHVVTFDAFIQNVGNPTIHIDKVGIIFIKPLLGEKIKTFTFSGNRPNNKIETGKYYKQRFAQAFDSQELAYEVINSQIEIKFLDIEGDVFSSSLLKSRFGDSI